MNFFTMHTDVKPRYSSHYSYSNIIRSPQVNTFKCPVERDVVVKMIVER